MQRIRSATSPTGASSEKAWAGRRCTKEPEPWREITTPSACRRESASRTTGRETP